MPGRYWSDEKVAILRREWKEKPMVPLKKMIQDHNLNCKVDALYRALKGATYRSANRLEPPVEPNHARVARKRREWCSRAS